MVIGCPLISYGGSACDIKCNQQVALQNEPGLNTNISSDQLSRYSDEVKRTTITKTNAC